MFGLMNSIFKSDSACRQRQLSVKTYQVVPLTSRVGLIEFVHSKEMKSFIFEGVSQSQQALFKDVAIEYKDWIGKTTPRASDEQQQPYMNACLKYSPKHTREKYMEFINSLPRDMLR